MLAIHSFLLIGLLFGGSSGLPQAPYTPRLGSPERKIIMDAARIPVEAKLHKRVIFKVEHLKVEGDWAFMTGIPQTPDGRLAYEGTEYEAGWRAGGISNVVVVLLQWQGDRWRVITYAIGPTDVVYEDWDLKYIAPGGIFS
jgi:hypothetical protein